MYQRIAHIALVVDDYDEAIAFYTQKLDFQVLEDTKLQRPVERKNVVYCLLKQPMKDKKIVLEIKPEDELDFFCLLMIFGEIIIKWWTGK